MTENNQKLPKRYYLYIPIVLGVVILLLSIVSILIKEGFGEKTKQKPAEERNLEEVLKSLTAPTDGGEIPDEVLKSISPPKQSLSAPLQETINSSTAPEQ